MWRKISLYAVPLGIALVAACGGSSKNSDDGGTGGAGGSSGGGGSGDSGVACGLQACRGSDVCCFSSGQPTCAAAGSCTSMALTCSSKSACSSGQSCCFTYTGDSGTDFETACQDSCDSTSYELCATSADCSNGGMCLPGPYARYCATFEGGFAFPDGGFTFPEGGPFRRRDASPEPPGDDGSTTPAGDDGSSDAASE